MYLGDNPVRSGLLRPAQTEHQGHLVSCQSHNRFFLAEKNNEVTLWTKSSTYALGLLSCELVRGSYRVFHLRAAFYQLLSFVVWFATTTTTAGTHEPVRRSEVRKKKKSASRNHSGTTENPLVQQFNVKSVSSFSHELCRHIHVMLNGCFSDTHTGDQPLNGILKIHRHLIWCEVTITRRAAESAASVRIDRHHSSTALDGVLIVVWWCVRMTRMRPSRGLLLCANQPHTSFQRKSVKKTQPETKTKWFDLRRLIPSQEQRGLPPYLAEIHVDVFAGLLVKLRATDLLGEVGNADGVAGVELLHQEIAAGLDHAVDLVHDGAVHHVNHALLPYRDAGCVGEFYQSVHHLNPRRGENHKGKG